MLSLFTSEFHYIESGVALYKGVVQQKEWLMEMSLRKDYENGTREGSRQKMNDIEVRWTV